MKRSDPTISTSRLAFGLTLNITLRFFVRSSRAKAALKALFTPAEYDDCPTVDTGALCNK